MRSIVARAIMCNIYKEHDITEKEMLEQIEARAEQMRNNAEVKAITRKEGKEAAERHLHRLAITDYFQRNG